MKLENENLNKPQKQQFNIGEMCKRCSGDGWVFYSNGGQSGLIKDCPKCDGKGVVNSSTDYGKN